MKAIYRIGDLEREGLEREEASEMIKSQRMDGTIERNEWEKKLRMNHWKTQKRHSKRKQETSENTAT